MAKERLRFRQRITIPSLPGVTAARPGRVLDQFSDAMGDLNKQITERADKRAVKRATERGMVAGRDPQFKVVEGEGIEIEAFNQAALDSFANRLEIRARNKASQLFDEHNQDPKQLDEKLGNYATGVAAEIPGELLDAFNLFWSKNTAPLLESAVKESRRIARNAQGATLSEVVDAKITGAERMAFVSEDDLVFETNINGERNDLFLKLLSHGPPQAFEVEGQQFPADPRRMGIVDPKAIVEQMEQYDRRVAMSRVLGKFDKSRKQGEGAEFARDWIDNPVKGFSNEERTKLAATMKAAISSDEAINKRVNDEAKAAEEIARSRRVGNLKRTVAAGDGTEEMIEAAFPTDISGDERAALLIAHDRAQEDKDEAISGQQRVAFAIQAGIPLDHKNPDDRKAVDAYYAKRFGGAAPTAETMTEVVDFIRDVAVIPTTVRSGIRSLARSANPDQAVLAADMVARIEKAAPQVLETMPKDEKAFSLMVSNNVAAGVENAVAVELARLRVYETPATEMTQLREVFTAKQFDKGNDSELNNLINDNLDPAFRLQPTAPPAMAGEYNDLVEQYYIRTRDEEVARTLAGRDLLRVWGVSDTKAGRSKSLAAVGSRRAQAKTKAPSRGRLQLMKHPPELVYGDGSPAPWMRRQLEQDMFAADPSIKPETLFLVTDDRTAREQSKTWQVWHLRKDGMPVPINDKDNRPARWRPQFDISDEGKSKAEANERKKARAAGVHQNQIKILSEGTVAERLFGVPAAKLRD